MGGPIVIPDGARPLTRRLLASFLEYAVKGLVTPDEVRRFMSASYEDPMMASAIREFRSLIPHQYWGAGHGTIVGQLFSKEASERVFAIAGELRSASAGAVHQSAE